MLSNTSSKIKDQIHRFFYHCLPKPPALGTWTTLSKIVVMAKRNQHFLGPENLQNKMQINVHFHCYYVNIRSWAHWDKQLVVPILQSGAIKPLEKERLQQNAVINWAPIKLQTNKSTLENMMEIRHWSLFHVLNRRRLQYSYRSAPIWCFHLLNVSSEVEASMNDKVICFMCVMIKCISIALCQVLLLLMHQLWLWEVHTKKTYTGCFKCLKISYLKTQLKKDLGVAN